MNFVIRGKIKPAVRMTRRGKYVSRQALEYLASKSAIQWQLKNQMQHNGWSMLPAGTPLSVSVVFLVPSSVGHTQDTDNLLKTTMDAAQGIVFANDLWVDHIEARRVIGDEFQTWLCIKVLD